MTYPLTPCVELYHLAFKVIYWTTSIPEKPIFCSYEFLLFWSKCLSNIFGNNCNFWPKNDDEYPCVFENVEIWWEIGVNPIPWDGIGWKNTPILYSHLALTFSKTKHNNYNYIKYQAKFFGPKECEKRGGCDSYDVYFQV